MWLWLPNIIIGILSGINTWGTQKSKDKVFKFTPFVFPVSETHGKICVELSLSLWSVCDGESELLTVCTIKELSQVSWVSFLISPSVVPGRMGLLVTLFLVLTNMFNTINTVSPTVQGLTSISIWLLGCIIFVAGAVAEYAGQVIATVAVGNICFLLTVSLSPVW